MEVAVVMEAAAGARWRTESPAVGGGRGTSAPLRWDPTGTPPSFWSPRTSGPPSFWSPTYFILLHYKTRLGKPSPGRWEEGKEGANPWLCTICSDKLSHGAAGPCV